VVQGAAISVNRARASIVARGDDCWYTAADLPGSKREETHTPCGDLLERVDAPRDDTSFTPDESSTFTECNASDGGDCKYSLVYTEMSETDEGGELARRDIPLDHDTWYTLADTEGSA